MRYLCNIGDSLLTSGICAWRLALLWRVGGICVDNASVNGGAAGRRRAGGWRVKWLREAEFFVYPTKISVSRNCFSYLPQQVFRLAVNLRTDTSAKRYH